MTRVDDYGFWKRLSLWWKGDWHVSGNLLIWPDLLWVLGWGPVSIEC